VSLVTDVCIMLRHGRWNGIIDNEDTISSYSNLKIKSTVHISQSTFLEMMFHTGLELQFTNLTYEYCICRNVFEKQQKERDN